MNKKGQGISINIIIVAVIALLVLVLVSFIFSGKIADFNKAVSNCDELSNTMCVYGNQCSEGYVKHATGRCYVGTEVDRSQSCCILAISP